VIASLIYLTMGGDSELSYLGLLSHRMAIFPCFSMNILEKVVFVGVLLMVWLSTCRRFIISIG